MSELLLFSLGQFLVGGDLQFDDAIVGPGVGADKFIELQL